MIYGNNDYTLKCNENKFLLFNSGEGNIFCVFLYGFKNQSLDMDMIFWNGSESTNTMILIGSSISDSDLGLVGLNPNPDFEKGRIRKKNEDPGPV